MLVVDGPPADERAAVLPLTWPLPVAGRPGRVTHATTTPVHCSVPAQLIAAVRAEHPGLNVSAVLTEALRARISCDHVHLTCTDCGRQVDLNQLTKRRLGYFLGRMIEGLDAAKARGFGLEAVERWWQLTAQEFAVTPLWGRERAEARGRKAA